MLVCESVRTSKRSFFYVNEIRYVGTGRRVMHDGVQYDPIQDQGQGHEPSKLEIRLFSKSKSISSAIFKRSWQLTTDS